MSHNPALACYRSRVLFTSLMFAAARAVVPPRRVLSIVALLTLSVGERFKTLYLQRVDMVHVNNVTFSRHEGTFYFCSACRASVQASAAAHRGAPTDVSVYLTEILNDIPTATRFTLLIPQSFSTHSTTPFRASADDVGKRYCSFRVPPYV